MPDKNAENSNLEIRNSKQYSNDLNSNDQNVFAVRPNFLELFSVLNIGTLGFWICLGFRTSNFGFHNFKSRLKRLSLSILIPTGRGGIAMT